MISPWSEVETDIHSSSRSVNNDKEKVVLIEPFKSYRSPKRSGASSTPSTSSSRQRNAHRKRVQSAVKVVETDPQTISIGPSVATNHHHESKGRVRGGGLLIGLLGESKTSNKKNTILVSTSDTATGRRVETTETHGERVKSDHFSSKHFEHGCDNHEMSIETLNVRGIAKKNPRLDDDINVTNASFTRYNDAADNDTYDTDDDDFMDTKDEKYRVVPKKRALRGLPKLTPKLLQRYKDMASKLSEPIDPSLIFSG
jgi:hypothetical protein